MTRRPMCACAIGSALVLATSMTAAAQTGQNPVQVEYIKKWRAGSEQFVARGDEAARLFEHDPRLGTLAWEQRKDLVEFVIGNLLFALLHELAHAHVQEMGLPVLGREEDAADSYAVVAMLKVGTEATHNVLANAAKGWFLSADRSQVEGMPLVYYDEHGMDRQRAYQIVCLMVGSDAEEFADLAKEMDLPEDRQGTCAGDYSNASWSWDLLLKSHLRTPDQPKQQIKVVYGEGGNYPVVARALRATGLMELLADYAANVFVWRRPITFDVKACGQPDLHWDLSNQTIVVCYEMAADFARLYRDYGVSSATAAR
jgi:hypothetical protein